MLLITPQTHFNEVIPRRIGNLLCIVKYARGLTANDIGRACESNITTQSDQEKTNVPNNIPA